MTGRNFEQPEVGLKFHVKLNHSGYIPEFLTVTEAQQHEVRELPRLKLKAGYVIVFNWGFTDFNQFATYCRENISSDHIIEMNGYYTKKKYPVRLRRVRIKDPETGKYILLLTNQFRWSPQTVAVVYKDRW